MPFLLFSKLRTLKRITNYIETLIYIQQQKKRKKLLLFKLIKNKICWIQELYIVCNTNCILYIWFYMSYKFLEFEIFYFQSIWK